MRPTESEGKAEGLDEDEKGVVRRLRAGPQSWAPVATAPAPTGGLCSSPATRTSTTHQRSNNRQRHVNIAPRSIRIRANDMRRSDQLFRFAKDRVGAAAYQITAQARDDAEGAAVVAALRDFQIAVVARGEFEPAFGHKVEEGIGRHRRCVVDRADDTRV